MARAFLREITRADVEQAGEAAQAIEQYLADHGRDSGLDKAELGMIIATLLTRPEKAVYVDVDYKIVTKPIVEGE